ESGGPFWLFRQDSGSAHGLVAAWLGVASSGGRHGLRLPELNAMNRAWVYSCVTPVGSKGLIPKKRSMRESSIKGKPIIAVGSSLRKRSIKAMPKLSALALPA